MVEMMGLTLLKSYLQIKIYLKIKGTPLEIEIGRAKKFQKF